MFKRESRSKVYVAVFFRNQSPKSLKSCITFWQRVVITAKNKEEAQTGEKSRNGSSSGSRAGRIQFN